MISATATTRVIAQNRAIALPQDRIIGIRESLALGLSGAWSRILILLFLSLISALGFVYMKDVNRQLFVNYQQAQHELVQLQNENNSLVLEESAWANQGRVHQIAEKQFDMVLPQAKSVVLLRAE